MSKINTKMPVKHIIADSTRGNSKMPAYEGRKGLLDSTVEKFAKLTKFDERDKAAKVKRSNYYRPLNFFGPLELWKRAAANRGFTVKKVSPAHIDSPHYHAIKAGKPVAHYNTFLNAGHI